MSKVLTFFKNLCILISVTITVIVYQKGDTMIKYSRQREFIKTNLINRYDHPTAETVYLDVKSEFPSISLGTVYRNLSLLTELGEIQKISTGLGPDRFDGNPAPHYHFLCKSCGCVMDIDLDNQDNLDAAASDVFPGIIKGHSVQFYGLCPECAKKLSH